MCVIKKHMQIVGFYVCFFFDKNIKQANIMYLYMMMVGGVFFFLSSSKAVFIEKKSDNDAHSYYTRDIICW